MKLTNAVCAATLAWLLVFGFDKSEQSKTIAKDTSPNQKTSVVEPKEGAVEQNIAPAEIFPRPRKPCPSGPGKQ